METRYIGIDLHRNRFTCCIRLKNGRTYLTEWAIADGRLRREPNVVQFLRLAKDENQVAVDKTS
jgi:hypothetical protein